MIELEYPDYCFQLREVKRLSARFKIGVCVIGKSLCGRNIFGLQIGNAARCSLIAGGFHGMEYLTVLSVLRFAEECAENTADLHGKGVMLVPCVNPDGTEIVVHGAKAACRYRGFVQSTGDETRWQANARGVDINHNFNADWRNVKKREREAGVTCPAATRFGGASPESEPETGALTRLCRRQSFTRALALHSQGREIYWDFGSCTPPECKNLANRLSEVSGYRAASPEPLATGGGFKDWFIQTFHRCGFTVEMGLGKNPLPLEDFEEEYPRVRRIFLEFVK